MSTKPDFNTLPGFYRNYVLNVQDQDMLQALELSAERFKELISNVSEDRGEYRYAPGKWSIKELICHMMDAERIFAYRALRFARNDATVLPGFEENDYAPQANAHSRTLKQLLTEAENLRKTTIDLFKSFTPEMLERKGSANGNVVSVINIGYIVSGHETHHCKILKERYLTA